jgi:ABC-type antimicrobial peptide transport system permease subunit
MVRSLFFFIFGSLLGIGLGLYIGWVVAPTELTDVTPAGLSNVAQQDYLLLVAAAYWEDDNFVAARQRLGELGRVDINEWILATTVDLILQGKDELEIRQMVYLANSLGLGSPAFAPYLPAKPAEGEMRDGG